MKNLKGISTRAAVGRLGTRAQKLLSTLLAVVMVATIVPLSNASAAPEPEQAASPQQEQGIGEEPDAGEATSLEGQVPEGDDDDPAVEPGSLAILEQQEEVGIAAQGIAAQELTPLEDGTEVTDWAGLRAAIANTAVTRIILKNDITRDLVGGTATQAAATANDLPAIARTLEIDGGGFTLNFNSRGATAVDRVGFYLASNTTLRSFTLQNIKVIRSAGTHALISGNNTSNTATTTNQFTNSKYWTVTVANISNWNGTQAGQPDTGATSLVGLSDGIVTYKGTIRWKINTDHPIVNARFHDFAPGSDVILWNGFNEGNISVSSSLADQARAIQSYPNENSLSAPAVIQATGGAHVELYSAENQAANLNLGNRDSSSATSTATPARVIVQGAGTHVYAHGTGYGTDEWGGTFAIFGGSGGFEVSGGAVLEVVSHGWAGSNGNNSYGQPALIQQITGGTFNVTGEGSHLLIQARFANNNYGGAIRFRYWGGQVFEISDHGRVDVIRDTQGATDDNNPAAIRFGTGAGNKLHVSGGGVLHVENSGNGTYANHGVAVGGNDAIEFDAGGFEFTLDGYLSAVELVARQGAALDAGSDPGTITMGPDTVFLASGRTNADTGAIFGAGTLTFTANSPRFYDFVNTRPGGGRVFAIGASSTFSSTNSDVAIWRRGVNAITGNADKNLTLISYALSGTSLGTISGTSDADMRAYYAQGTAYRMENYTRINGNNAGPVIGALLDLTNADRYVRASARVPEGLDQDGRGVMDDEAFATIKVTPFDDPTHPYEVRGIALETDTYYEAETGVGALDGAIHYALPTGFLKVGDTYQVIDAWRGDAARTVGKIHPASASDIDRTIRTVADATPPLPATVTSEPFYANQRNLAGTWTLDAAYNADPPTTVYAALNGVVVPGVFGIVNGDGTWTYALPSSVSLAENDKVQIILEDAAGNANPLATRAFRDATFPPATTVIVQKVLYDITGANAEIGTQQAQDILDSMDVDAAIITQLGAQGIDSSKPVGSQGTAIEVASAGGLSATPGLYTITLVISDTKAGTPWTKAFTIRVLPNEYIVLGARYSIGYDAAPRMNKALAASITDAGLLLRHKVTVYDREDNYKVVPDRAAVTTGSRSFPLDAAQGQTKPGTFNVHVINDVPEAIPSTNATVPVTIGDGALPTVAASSPLQVVSGVASYNPLQDVTSNDLEDGLNGPAIKLVETDGAGNPVYDGEGNPVCLDPTYANSNVSGKLSIPGVYVDTYTAVDSDGNYAAPVKRVIVVNDGTYSVGPRYIVYARSYAIAKTAVAGTNDEVLAQSHAAAWNAQTGAVATPVVIDKDGYTGTAGVYPATIGVVGDDGDPLALRPIKIQVIDREVIADDGNGFFVGANSFRINTTDELGVTNARLLTRASAVAYVVTSAIGQADIVASVPAAVDAYTGNRDGIPAGGGSTALYDLSVANSADPATKALVNVTLSNGNPPVITTATPLVIEKGTGIILSSDPYTGAAYIGEVFDYSQGVAATDDFDIVAGDPTHAFTGPVTHNTVYANWGTAPAGVYTVVYSATDSDGNTATSNRVVVVDDGSITIGGTYIIQARNFVALLKDVPDAAAGAAALDAHILSKSGARAWYKEDGADHSAGEIALGALVLSKAGYHDAVGAYTPIVVSAVLDPGIGLIPDATAIRNITGKVVDADLIFEDDPSYIITANNFALSLDDALLYNTDVLMKAALISRSGATAYERATLNEVGVTVTDETVPAPPVIGEYTASYAVTGHEAVSVRGTVDINSGNPPALTATTPLEVEKGTGNIKMPGDASGVYSGAPFTPLAGITVIDQEDGAYPTANANGLFPEGNITWQGSVDLNVDGVYTVVYTATDLVGNQDTATRIVVVNDGTYTVAPDYILQARGFVIKGSDVQPNSQAQVLVKTRARAWNAQTGVPVEAFVGDFGTPLYSSTPDDYTITIAVSNNTTVTAPVTARVISQTIIVEPEDGDDHYYITADEALINSYDYDRATPATIDLLARCNVHAYRDDRVATEVQTSDLTTSSFNGTTDPDGTYDGRTGVYGAVFSITLPDANGKSTGTVKVTVDDRNAPVLEFSNPVSLKLNDPSFTTPLDGVTATDVEDGALVPVIDPGSETVDLTTAGVYVVVISATDSDHNTVTGLRTFVVGDLIIGDRYIIGAASFNIKDTLVDVSSDAAKRRQILTASGTQVWTRDGAYVDNDPTKEFIYTGGATPVTNLDTLSTLRVADGGYTNVAQDTPYAIVIDFSDDPKAKENIDALVWTGAINDTGDYLLNWQDFSITIAQAKTVTGLNRGTAAANAQVVAWGHAKVFDKAHGFALVPNGAKVDTYTIEAVSNLIPGYEAIYSVNVANPPVGTGTAKVKVLGGAPPTVNASSPLDIEAGTASYDPLTNVTAADPEDAPAGYADKSNIYLVKTEGGTTTYVAPTYANSNVDLGVPGVYVDTYTALDSDDNYATPVKRVVVVNDGTYSVGSKYIVYAQSYAIAQADVLGTDAEILAESGPARAWSAITGDAAVPVVSANGGYTAAEGVYPATIGVSGDEGTPVAGQARRDIKIQVIDREVITSDGKGHFVGANAFKMNSTAETGIDDETLLANANAVAYVVVSINKQPDTVTQVDAAVPNGGYSGHRDGTKGEYILSVANSQSLTTVAVVKVQVTDGLPPQISFDTPVVISKGAGFNNMTGVTATDHEDGPLPNSAIHVVAVGPAVDTSAVGVYTLTYSVTDSDFNTVTRNRVVVVNDGSIIVGDTYVIQARNFVALLREVPSNSAALDAHILTKAGARAWYKEDGAGHSAGQPFTGELVVVDSASYQKAVGTYAPIKITTLDETSLPREITGKVVDADHIFGTDDYVITANDVSMLLSEADAGGLADAALVSRSQATAYNRANFAEVLGATVASKNVPTAGVTGAGWANYAIAGHTEVRVQGAVEVTQGDPPVLSVNPITYTVALGAAYDPQDGVSATDPQDGSLTFTASPAGAGIRYTGLVNTAVDGVYPIVYTATDSDGNTDTKTRIVVVDDGTYTITSDYILRARGFVIKGSNVLTNDQTQTQVLTKSKAKAWDATTGDEVAAVVTNFNGYSRIPANYTITIAVDNERTVTATITAKVISQTILVEPDDDGDHYFIAADPARLNPVDYDTTTRADLIGLTNANAWKDDRGLDPKAVQVDDFTGELGGALGNPATTYNGVQGNYFATFSVIENPATRVVDVPVLVTTGGFPEIAFTQNPVTLPLGTGTAPDAVLLDGVTATDKEDNDNGLTVTPVVAANSPAVDLATEGVYVVYYSATDSDYNTTTKPRTFVVGDLVVGDTYIVGAEDFYLHEDDVETADPAKRSQVLSESHTKVWRRNADGSATPVASPAAIDTLGIAYDGAHTYTNVASDTPYPLTISFSDDLLATKSIKALVYKGTIIERDGYLLNYQDIPNPSFPVFSRENAQSVTGINKMTDVSRNKLIEWGVAKAFKLVDFALVPVEVVDYDIQDNALQTWHVTYQVAEKPTVTGTNDVTVTGGAPPTVNATTPIEIWVGGSYDPMTNVSAHDSEDDANGIPVSVQLNGRAPTLANSNVDVNTPGVYVDTYLAVDSEANESLPVT
ncbi:MAG: DUF5011 domain-containing protein, partial [Coriobacteriales bacterium]|nr:DUF5011 domain-containing protein [Coriobacteriales bacterium]